MADAFPSFAGGSSTQSSPKIVRVCNAIISWSLILLTFLVPLFFLPWTIEVSELNKQLILLLGSGLAGMAWIGRMLAERKFEYRRTVVNVFVVLFVGVSAISSWLSQSRYSSLIGDFGQEKAGFLTVLAFAILYFVVANTIKNAKDISRIFASMMIGGFLVALIGLLQGVGIFAFPFEFAKATSFNTVGTAPSMALYLAFIVTLGGGLLMAGHQKNLGKPTKLELLYQVMIVVTSVMSLLIIAVLDFAPVTVSLFVASAISIIFAFVHADSMKGIRGAMLPIAALILTALLLLFRFPVSFGYPAEVMPSLKASMDIAVKTLRERPLFGSGPGTFIFDYAKHHAADVNQTMFWNIRFDRGASRFLTLLATTGLIGALSWALVALFLLGSAARRLLKANEETWHILVGVFAAWVLLTLAKFLYSSNLTLEFASWLSMALLVVLYRSEFRTVKFENSPRAAMVLSFVFILGLVFSGAGLFVEGQRYAAEIRYANAIRSDRAGGDIDKVVSELEAAANLNQSNDVYLRNLALAYLAKADKEFGTPVDLKKEDKESDDDFKKRQQAAADEQVRRATALTASAVNIAKRATDINPENVANWTVLSSIYQSLMGVTQDADAWAVASYEKAMSLEPTNPSNHAELGKVYIFQSDLIRQALQNIKDEEQKKTATKQSDDLLAKAVDTFNKSIELKSDYAPAHFNLSLALDRQGKLKEAISRMENVVALSPQDVGVGFQLALLYYRDERKDDAMALLGQVIKLSPNYSNALWYLAAMEEEKGDLDAAIEHVAKVLELNKDNELVSKKLEDLKGKKANPAPAATELPQPVDQPVENQGQPSVKR